jgi:hypothetical protein
MFKIPLLCSAALIASVGISMPAAAQEDAIPGFMSANFGWLLDTGFDFRPTEGKVVPVGPDPNWRGGIGLPANDFNYQPPAAGSDSRPQGASHIGPWNIERLSDAENPNLKPWAAAQMRMHNELVSNGQRAFSAMSRCWPGGGPGQLLFGAEPIYFIQTPQEVWILWQRDHLVRRVFLNRGHSPNPKPSWFGESVGHYENGELIVDTIGFAEHPYSFVDNWRTPHTKDLHVVERWKVVGGGNAIEALVAVDDPGAFIAPWSGLVRWTKVNRPMIESTCAENNENYEKFLKLREYPMPEAKTLDFLSNSARSASGPWGRFSVI